MQHSLWQRVANKDVFWINRLSLIASESGTLAREMALWARASRLGGDKKSPNSQINQIMRTEKRGGRQGQGITGCHYRHAGPIF